MPVDKSASRVRRMFGDISARYDLLNHLLSLNVDRHWRRATTRRVAPIGHQPILDVCTGTGDLALAYYRSTKGAVAVHGADFCHEMLVLARQEGQRVAGATSPVFVEADAQRLPYDDNRFQIVCVAFGLRNVSDTSRGLAEMARVCAPGGQVAVLEFSMPRLRPLRAGYGFYFRRVLPFLGQLLARNRHGAYNYLPASVLEFPQGEALAELMRQAGLVSVAWHRLTFGVATLYVGRKLAAPGDCRTAGPTRAASLENARP